MTERKKLSKWKIIDNPVASDPDAPPLVLVNDVEMIVDYGDTPSHLSASAFEQGADEVAHNYSYAAQQVREVIYL